ncbi:transcriptional regulator, PadR-family [Gemmatirosa kalamazoonensis]|uniref:Transcriptional regulator, PadR-family n=1 Tax=Gemmatirosa kalamazoonensis TaxID=861299 RepID=W0RHI4_9BACT|nr:PadR family transcriptional regulator [Gemmatirosa kalamazoonensis]AHG88863.1 transcriptional regulator, PadR-family [Gemmatirosa kalamazoonensis]
MTDDAAIDILLGTLDVLVLKTLSWGPSHGYGIARWIRESSGNTFRILDGALYTALHRLEERGAIEAEWGHTEQGKRAKFYRLTTAGRRELRVQAEQWERYAAGMTGVLTTAPRPA